MSTIYLAEQRSALADLRAAGTAFLVEFNVNTRHDPATGKTVAADEPAAVITYGILTTPTRATFAMVKESLAERISSGATIASLPILDADRELSVTARVTVAGRKYNIHGFTAIQPDGFPIIYKLALEAL